MHTYMHLGLHFKWLLPKNKKTTKADKFEKKKLPEDIVGGNANQYKQYYTSEN